MKWTESFRLLLSKSLCVLVFVSVRSETTIAIINRMRIAECGTAILHHLFRFTIKRSGATAMAKIICFSTCKRICHSEHIGKYTKKDIYCEFKLTWCFTENALFVHSWRARDVCTPLASSSSMENKRFAWIKRTQWEWHIFKR